MLNKFLGLTCVALMLAGCSSRPSSVVEDFYGAIEAGEQDAAISRLSPEVVNMLGESKLRSALGNQTRQIAECGGIADLQTELTGDDFVQRGTVKITFAGPCEPKIEKVKLVKVDDEWKIGVEK
jgi:hypothetical protein